MPIVPFKPHPLIRGGHLQTIVGRLSGWTQGLAPDEILTIEMPDKDQLAIELNQPPKASSKTPVVALFHGLGGSSESSYVIRAAQKLGALGFRVARFNHRGCDRHQLLRARQIYHSGSLKDVRAGIVAIRNRWPHAPILTAGFSLSGAILLNLIGQEPDIRERIQNLRKVMAICPPIDLESSSKAVADLRNRHIDLYYSRSLLAAARRRQQKHPDAFSPQLPRSLTVRAFDELFTAQVAGFKSRDDYYNRCSPKRFVDLIAVPTTVVVAADDPVVPIESVTTAPFSEAVQLRVEKSGGHMGFLAATKTRFGDYRWMDDIVVSWAEQFFSEEVRRHRNESRR